MSEQTNLMVVRQTVQFAGATVTKSSLMVAEGCSDDQLAEMGVALSVVHASCGWWLGDYGIALQERKGEEYRTGRAEILGISESLWANCVMIARYFPASRRLEALSIYHHWEAIRGAGGVEKADLKAAIRWLNGAVKNKWSVSQMREQVNKSLATLKPPDTPPLENIFLPLDEADKWAHQHLKEANVTDPEHAKALLTRFQELISFFERLREIANGR
jgi:hypothetical protein